MLPMSKPLQAFRSAFLQRSVPRSCKRLLDFGCGTGAFCRSACKHYTTFGYDINHYYQTTWREDASPITYSTKLQDQPYDVVTFFDSLEHVQDPVNLIKFLSSVKVFIVSLPVMEKTAWPSSRHLKPLEHLHYFTFTSIFKLFAKCGYALTTFSEGETILGRQDILTFAFRKWRPATKLQ